MRIKLITIENPLLKFQKHHDMLGFDKRQAVKYLFPDESFDKLKNYILNQENIATTIETFLLIMTVKHVRLRVLQSLISTKQDEFSRKRPGVKVCDERIIQYFQQHPEFISIILSPLEKKDRDNIIKQLTFNKLDTGAELIYNSLYKKNDDIEVQGNLDHDEELIKEVFKRFIELDNINKPNLTGFFDTNFTLQYLRERIYNAKNAGLLMFSCLEKITHCVGKKQLLYWFLIPEGHKSSKKQPYSEQPLDSRFLTISKKYRNKILRSLVESANRPFRTRAKDHMNSKNLITIISSINKDSDNSAESNPKKKKGQPDLIDLVDSEKEIINKEQVVSKRKDQQLISPVSSKRKKRDNEASEEQQKPNKRNKIDSPNIQWREDCPDNGLTLKKRDFSSRNSMLPDNQSLSWFEEESLTTLSVSRISSNELMSIDILSEFECAKSQAIELTGAENFGAAQSTDTHIDKQDWIKRDNNVTKTTMNYANNPFTMFSNKSQAQFSLLMPIPEDDYMLDITEYK